MAAGKDPLIGQTIGNTYVIERALDSGGMASVYIGRHRRSGEKVAIKVIRRDKSDVDPDRMDRLFDREATALKKVSSDAVVAFEAFLIGPDDTMCLVMEYVRGSSLGDYIKRDQYLQSPLDGWVLGERLAEALSALHGQGMAHRDVSPENVVIPDGKLAQAKLVDLGIVKIIGEKSSLIGSQFAGKMRYASPEQIKLGETTIDAASDIYSMALVIARAYGVDWPVYQASSDALALRRGGYDLTKVPEALRDALAQMLAFEPEHRPDDVLTFWRAAREQAESPPPPPPPPPEEQRRRSRGLLQIVSMATIISLCVLGGAWIHELTESESDAQQVAALVSQLESPDPSVRIAAYNSLDDLRRDDNGEAYYAVARLRDPQYFEADRVPTIQEAPRRALSYYRKAFKLGVQEAAPEISRLEESLQ